jgi:hypothetical protein
MNIQNSYKVGDKVFSNIKEAQKYVLEIMYSNGLDWIIENGMDFSEALLQYKDIKPMRKIQTERKAIPNSKGKGDLAGIVELLKQKYDVKRDPNNWPVYHFYGINENQSFSIRFIGKVFELYELVEANIENLESVLEEYKTK